MAKVVVVIAYDDQLYAPSERLPIQVAQRVRPLFDGKSNFEVHIASGGVALTLLNDLADRELSQ